MSTMALAKVVTRALHSKGDDEKLGLLDMAVDRDQLRLAWRMDDIDVGTMGKRFDVPSNCFVA